MLVKEGG